MVHFPLVKYSPSLFRAKIILANVPVEPNYKHGVTFFVGKFLFTKYRVVKLNFTPEIEVFYMLLERSLSYFSITYLKHNIEYFHFRYKSSLTSL